MAPQKKSVREFLDGVSDDKLYDLGGKEHNIAMDMVGGYRLDYQGGNDDPNEAPYVHRLYIQPVGSNKAGTKSKRAKKAQDNKAVLARCHASDEATPEQVRDALAQSYLSKETLPNQTIQHPICYAPPVIEKKT